MIHRKRMNKKGFLGALLAWAAFLIFSVGIYHVGKLIGMWH